MDFMVIFVKFYDNLRLVWKLEFRIITVIELCLKNNYGIICYKVFVVKFEVDIVVINLMFSYNKVKRLELGVVRLFLIFIKVFLI